MRTSLYYSVGAVDAVEWACVLCSHCIQNDWASRAANLHQILHGAWTFLCGNYSDDSEGFQDDAMSCSTHKSVARTLKRGFKDGWETVGSDPRSGRPVTSRTPENVERVQTAINQDRRPTVWELGADLGTPNTTVSEILMQDLGMKHVVAKFIPQLLLPEQKEHRAAVANDFIQTTANEPDFLKKVIPRDESWVYGCDPETKSQLCLYLVSSSGNIFIFHITW